MSSRMRIMVGLLASIAGLATMGAVWIGVAPQSFLVFVFGIVLAVGGAATAASAIKARNALSAQSKEPEKLRLGVMALMFAIFGGLLMVFCGGCTLFAVLGEVGGSSFKTSAAAAIVFGGFPFTIGLVIWLLAMASKKPRR